MHEDYLTLVPLTSSPWFAFIPLLLIMRSLCAIPPLNFKLPLISHQLAPFSPLNKNVTVADANNATAAQTTSSDRRPATICTFKVAKPVTSDIRRFPQAPPACDISVAKDTASENASPDSCSGDSTSAPATCSSIFPVIGPFDLLSCIQKGAFGAAWAARDQNTGRLLCLKVFRSLHEPGVTRSVHTELKLYRRMVKSKAGERGKQFIIELNRSIQHNTNVFFAMELMTTDLCMYLYLQPERCKEHARRWMAQMALGIQSLHDMGILHRDIKSENILIDSRENVRIIDFGLAYLNPTGKPLRQGTECAVDFLGTVSYMAPEVLRNKGIPVHWRRHYGIAVDWWALGCILFELESQDHQILFDTEDDLHAYVTWTQRACQVGEGETCSRFQDLDPIVVDLLERLLEVCPLDRFSLSDMEKHDYFLHRNGTSEFENAAARALERPICPELVPQFTEEEEPALVIQAAELSSMYDWTNLKCARL